MYGSSGKRDYEFLFLCFRLGPVSIIFAKNLNLPISLLRWLQISVIIYLEDMLIMLRTPEELLMSRETTIFLLTQLAFVIVKSPS